MLNRSWLSLGTTAIAGLGCSSASGGPGGPPESTAAVSSPVTTGTNSFSPRYHYVSLDSVPLPAGYVVFDPTIGIDDLGRIFGNVYDANLTPYVAEYTQGKLRVLQHVPTVAAVFPTVSNQLLFNVENLIVITQVSAPSAEVGNSYIVPRPGVRLNLADLVDDVPATSSGAFSVIADLNDIGEMVGSSLSGDTFLLEPIVGP